MLCTPTVNYCTTPLALGHSPTGMCRHHSNYASSLTRLPGPASNKLPGSRMESPSSVPLPCRNCAFRYSAFLAAERGTLDLTSLYGITVLVGGVPSSETVNRTIRPGVMVLVLLLVFRKGPIQPGAPCHISRRRTCHDDANAHANAHGILGRRLN